MTEEAQIKFALVDINGILQLLPHRFPMLLIDRVINIRISPNVRSIRAS